jgi:hypothetical protein
MNQEELYETIQNSEMTVTDLQSLSDDIREHTGLYVPNRPTEVEDWWERKKGVVARRLNPDADDEEEESATSETTETETESDN